MSKMFLSCGCCGGGVEPYNMGLFSQMCIDAGDTTLVGTDVGPVPGRCLTWYRYRSREDVADPMVDNINVMLSPVFGTQRDKYLHGVHIGAPWSLPATPWGLSSGRRYLTNSLTVADPTVEEIEAWFTDNMWLPDLVSDEFDILVDHLAAGRDLVINVPPLSWYYGTFNSSTYEANFSVGDTELTRLNAFLTAIGSSTTALALQDASLTRFAPVIPQPGIRQLGWTGTNRMNETTAEVLAIDDAISPSTDSISSEYLAGEYPIAFHPVTYFRNADTSTYLEGINLREVRFDSQQAYDSGTTVEVTQLGRYAYVPDGASSAADPARYLVHGVATTTAAVAIREQLPGGGTLYLLPASWKGGGFLAKLQMHNLHHVYNLITTPLGSRNRSARRANCGWVDPNLSTSITGLLQHASYVEPQHFSGTSEIREIPATTHQFSENTINGNTLADLYIHSTINLTAGLYVGGVSDESLPNDQWSTNTSGYVEFETPDQGEETADAIAGPHYVIASRSPVFSTAQHPMTLTRFSPYPQLTTDQERPYSEAVPFINAGMTADAGYGDYRFTSAFASDSRGALATLQRQRIVAIVETVPRDTYLQLRLRQLNNTTVELIRYDSMPAIYQGGHIWIPKRQRPRLLWEFTQNGAQRMVAGTLAGATTRYPLTDFVRLDDPTTPFDLDAEPLFALLSCHVLPDLEWGMNPANDRKYTVASNQTINYDFEFRTTSGATLDGVSVEISAVLDNTFGEGETITYTIDVTNDSINTLDIEVTVPAIGYSNTLTALAPEGTDADSHAYTITAADVEAGLKVAIANAVAEIPTGTYRADDSVTVIAPS